MVNKDRSSPLKEMNKMQGVNKETIHFYTNPGDHHDS